MLRWLLLRLSISAALLSTVDLICTDNALSFKFVGADLIFDTENAKKFLSGLCTTSYGSDFILNNTHDKMDIISAIPNTSNATSLSNIFLCSYNVKSIDTISCSLLVVNLPKRCVTSFDDPGCDQIFNTVNCSADSISLTWTHPYTVTCHLNDDTLYVNSTCIDDQNINYTIKDCESGAHHISTFSPPINVTLSTNKRETFITTANVSEVHPIERVTDNNRTTIVAVTVSLGSLLFIFFICVLTYVIRRRRQNAKSKKTSLDDAMDKGKAKTFDNVDAMFPHKYSQAKTTLTVEPYHVMELNEIINDVEPTNGKTFTFQIIHHESTHYASVDKSEHKSVNASSLIVHSEMEKSNENLTMGKIDEESGSVYSKLGERIKDVQNVYGMLQVQSDAALSDRISPAADDQISKPCSLEPIYFELER